MQTLLKHLTAFCFVLTSFYVGAQNASDMIDLADSIYYSDPDESCKLCLQALKKAEQESDRMISADAKMCLARYYLLKADYQKTAKFITTSIQQFNLLVDGKNDKQIKSRLASAYNLNAILYDRLNEKQKSYDYQNEAIRLFKEIDNIQGMTNIMHNLTNCYIEDNRLSQASALLDEIEKYNDRISQGSMYFFYQNKGLLALAQKKNNDAINWLKKALTVAQEQKMLDSEITAYTLLGKAYTMFKNYALAEKSLSIAEELAIKQNLDYEQHEIYKQQVVMLKQQGKVDEAAIVEAKLVSLESNSEKEALEAYQKKRAEDSVRIEQKKRELMERQKQLIEEERSKPMRFMIFALIGTAVIVLAIFLFQRRRRK